MQFHHGTFESPIGTLHIVVSDDKLHAVLFGTTWPEERDRFADLVEDETPLLEETRRQLADYFAGKSKLFHLPLHIGGTDFQKRIWATLPLIPYGQTRTYREQAIAAGKPDAVRAVGRTNGQNRLCIVLPCHRVVGADGSLTGYAGGVEAKRFLLALEGALLNV